MNPPGTTGSLRIDPAAAGSFLPELDGAGRGRLSIACNHKGEDTTMVSKARVSLVVGAVWAATLLVASAASAADVDANALWSKNCSICHGKDAKGDTKVGKERNIKDLTDPKVQAELKKPEMIKKIKEGVKDDKTGKERMKAFGEKLSDPEINALVDWVLALKH
ncbi:MAG TPA: cytochrome c [Candidatus Binatia bacterium]|jgi:mono/diheme cytochrome c family protein